MTISKKYGTAVLLILVFCAAAGALSGVERRISVSPETEPVEVFSIEVPQPCPVTVFAAGELKRALEKTLGSEVKRGVSDDQNGITLVLGDSPEARRTGLHAEKLPQDGFYIRRIGRKIFLLGLDSKDQGPGRNTFYERYPRGTLFAAYDFLERFAGTRFYFPGECGTIHQKRESIALPAKIDILDRPDFAELRKISHTSGKWYEKNEYHGILGYNLNLLRLRLETDSLPLCHGLSMLNLDRRFAESNPAFFALCPDGRRYCGHEMRMSPQLCFSNPALKNVIYEDVKAALTGMPASLRNVSWKGRNVWNPNFVSHGVVSVMPQDSFYWCGCSVCSRIAKPGRNYGKKNQAISNAVWSFTAELAERLKKEKIQGRVSQMAYFPYNLVPDCAVPGNVIVILGQPGPGRKDTEEDDALLEAWNRKLGRKVMIWTYPGKHLAKSRLKGIPVMNPRGTGRYFQERKHLLNGAYIESETDYYLFNYLPYYIFGKVTWNTSCDIEALLEEHYRLMFGSGASEIRDFYDKLELLWQDKVIGKFIDTPYGPTPSLPDRYRLWKEIYSPQQLESFRKMFDRAERAAAKEPDALKRIRFIRKNILDILIAEAEKQMSELVSAKDWACFPPCELTLLPFKGEKSLSFPHCRITEEKDAFRIQFECPAPKGDPVSSVHDDRNFWNGSTFEIFLNPSGDRKEFCQIAVNPAGITADALYKNGTREISWESGAVVRSSLSGGKWKGDVLIPKKSLDRLHPEGFPVNFGVTLYTDSGRTSSQWSPLESNSFHNINTWGMLHRNSHDRNLLKNGDFSDQPPGKGFAPWMIYLSGGKGGGQAAEANRQDLIWGKQSIKLTGTQTTRISLSQKTVLKKNTRYHFSFYLKLDHVVSEKGGVRGCVILADGKKYLKNPSVWLTGTTPWRQYQMEFTTGADDSSSGEIPALCSILFRNASGSVYVDRVRLLEISETER